MNVKKKTIKEEWTNLYTTISFDGFHYIFETTGFRRAFWAILFTIMFALSTVLFYGNIHDYITYSTTTIQQEVFDIDELKFPTVTICNMNSVSAKKLDQANVTSIPRDRLLKFYENLKEGKLDITKGDDKKILEILETEHNVTSWRQIITMFELGIEEMLEDPVLKSFKEHPCLFDAEPCTADDFSPVLSEEFGLCFQFNSFYSSKRVRHAVEAGVGIGLHMYLNIHEDDMLVSKVSYQGLTVFVHPLGTPFETSIAKRAPASTGRLSFIHAKLTKIKLLEAPYPTNCSSKEYDYVYKEVPYFQSMCAVDCAIQKMVDKCGCVTLELAHHTAKVKECTLSHISCIESMTGNLSRIMRKCRHNCPVECDFQRFDIDSSQVILGNKFVHRRVRQYLNTTTEKAEAYISKNIVGIDANFVDLTYIQETVTPASNWSTLLGAIGGNLGLCLGCSLLTFIELLVFAMEALYKKFTKSAKDNSKETKQPENMRNMLNAA